MIFKARIFFLTLLCLLGASLVAANAQTHDLDPSHSSDECAVCVIGELPLDDGLDATGSLSIPAQLGWMSRDFGSAETPYIGASTAFRARGPPSVDA